MSVGNPCNCCEEPTSCNYDVLFDQKFGFASKCGALGFSADFPPAVYKVRLQRTLSDGTSFTRTCEETYIDEHSECDCSDVPAAKYVLPPDYECNGCDVPDGGLSDTHRGDKCNGPSPPDPPDHQPCFSEDLSEEDDTASMVGRAQGRLDSAEWVENTNSGYSQRFFPANELQCGLVAVRMHIQHAPTASCFLRAWARTRYCPVGGTEPDDDCDDWGEWEQVYIWEGSGNPCMSGCSSANDKCIDSGILMTIDPPDDVGDEGYGSIRMQVCVTCDRFFTAADCE